LGKKETKPNTQVALSEFTQINPSTIPRLSPNITPKQPQITVTLPLSGNLSVHHQSEKGGTTYAIGAIFHLYCDTNEQNIIMKRKSGSYKPSTKRISISIQSVFIPCPSITKPP